MPITVNSTVNTSPLIQDRKSPGARCTAPTDESGKVRALIRAAFSASPSYQRQIVFFAGVFILLLLVMRLAAVKRCIRGRDIGLVDIYVSLAFSVTVEFCSGKSLTTRLARYERSASRVVRRPCAPGAVAQHVWPCPAQRIQHMRIPEPASQRLRTAVLRRRAGPGGARRAAHR